ncbi:MAG: serine/threonine protein phosphatase, partial [Pygmaiobacter sp.]
SISFLNNNCFFAEDVAICGSRSWLFDMEQPHDAKVMNRELGRLRASLLMAGDAEKLVFLHYPPIYPNGNADEIVGLLHEFGVKRCFYGHLHGGSIPFAVQGDVDGIYYKLISADSLHFCPYKVK